MYVVTLWCCFFLMIRRPPRSTLDRSSAASDVYKRQIVGFGTAAGVLIALRQLDPLLGLSLPRSDVLTGPVSYTHLRAHETVLDLVCRLLLAKKKNSNPTCETHILISTVYL